MGKPAIKTVPNLSDISYGELRIWNADLGEEQARVRREIARRDGFALPREVVPATHTTPSQYRVEPRTHIPSTIRPTYKPRPLMWFLGMGLALGASLAVVATIITITALGLWK